VEGLPEGFCLSTVNVNFDHQRPVMSSFEILDRLSEAIDWFRPGRSVSHFNDRAAAVAGVWSKLSRDQKHPLDRHSIPVNVLKINVAR